MFVATKEAVPVERTYQCHIDHVTLPMFCHWLERDWGWQIFDTPGYAWPDLRTVDYGHADEFERYYDVMEPDAPPNTLPHGRIWLAAYRSDRLYFELFVRHDDSWVQRVDIWLLQRYNVQLNNARLNLMIRPAPPLSVDELTLAHWQDEGRAPADYFDWWYRGGHIFYPDIHELGPVIGIDDETLRVWHEDEYRKRYGPRPMPNSQSQFSGIL
jgi:hypothetical protein